MFSDVLGEAEAAGNAADDLLPEYQVKRCSTA